MILLNEIEIDDNVIYKKKSKREIFCNDFCEGFCG